MDIVDLISKQIPIASPGDAGRALVSWSDVYKILPATRSLREDIVNHLITECKKYGVKPHPMWEDILENPEFYDKWRDALRSGAED